jgi:hypothetical protein
VGKFDRSHVAVNFTETQKSSNKKDKLSKLETLSDNTALQIGEHWIQDYFNFFVSCLQRVNRNFESKCVLGYVWFVMRTAYACSSYMI